MSLERLTTADLEARHGSARAEDSIRIRTAAEAAAALPRSEWLLRPYLERNALVMLYGDFGSFKSFVLTDWALRVALALPALGFPWPASRADVVLISAEGRGLAKRLRGWCIRNCPGEAYVDVLKRASLYVVEHPVNLSDPITVLSLVDRIDALGIEPGFLIIDTLSRNSDGTVENSTTDAARYLANIDQGLRARYHCCVAFAHHVGHVEKGRMRGPIALASNTDACIRIERPDPAQRIATLTLDRLKDSDPRAPQAVRAVVVELGETDEDGQPVTTLALEPTECLPEPRSRPTGKNQLRLLGELEKRHKAGDRVWTEGELRKLARDLGMHRCSARDAVVGLVTAGYLHDSVGGRTLKHPPEARK